MSLKMHKIYLDLEESTNKVKEIEAKLKEKNNALYHKHLLIWKRRVSSLKLKIKDLGVGLPITIVEFGTTTTETDQNNPAVWRAVKNVEKTVYYPTHERDELILLIKRDFGDLLPIAQTKVFTGIPK